MSRAIDYLPQADLTIQIDLRTDHQEQINLFTHTTIHIALVYHRHPNGIEKDHLNWTGQLAAIRDSNELILNPQYLHVVNENGEKTPIDWKTVIEQG